MALMSLPVNLTTYNPAVTMATLVSLKSMAPLAFLGLFPTAGAPHGLSRLLMFPCACPHILSIPTPFDVGLHSYSDKVAGSSSPWWGFWTWLLIFTMLLP